MNLSAASCVLVAWDRVDDYDDVTAFCRRIHPRLLGAMVLQTGDGELAADVTQEALARTCERWPSVRTMERPEGWVFRVAFNMVASGGRRRRSERAVRERLESGWVEARIDADPVDLFTVRAALDALAPRQRAVIVLRYFADLSVADTATVLDCAQGTVKSLTSSAMSHLRDRLELDAPAADPGHG